MRPFTNQKGKMKIVKLKPGQYYRHPERALRERTKKKSKKKRRKRRKHFNSYHEYIASEEWIYNRDLALAKTKKECAICSSRIRLEAHHLTYRNLYREKRSDLCWLCQRCHAQVSELTGTVGKNGKRLNHRTAVDELKRQKRTSNTGTTRMHIAVRAEDRERIVEAYPGENLEKRANAFARQGKRHHQSHGRDTKTKQQTRLG